MTSPPQDRLINPSIDAIESFRYKSITHLTSNQSRTGDDARCYAHMRATQPDRKATSRRAEPATYAAQRHGGSPAPQQPGHGRTAVEHPPPQPAEAPRVPLRDDDRRLEVRRRGVLQQLVADVDVGRVEVDRRRAGVVEFAAAAPGPGFGEHVPEARVLDAAAAPAAAPTRRPGPDGGARRRRRGRLIVSEIHARSAELRNK